MWSFSKAFSGAIGVKNKMKKQSQVLLECSEDEAPLNTSSACGEEALECPICWESFNIVENVPYVLWCGHTLCKNCVLGLQRPVLKLPTLPIKLPFFISCPWCNLLSIRLIYKGNLKFPCKNYFLLWMVESKNGDRSKSHSSFRGCHQPVSSANKTAAEGNHDSHQNTMRSMRIAGSNHNEGPVITRYFSAERLQLSLRKSLAFFMHITTKFPLIVLFLLMTLYAIPASAAILIVYILITVVFAIPSFLVLYFAFPSLDWLVREIIT